MKAIIVDDEYYSAIAFQSACENIEDIQIIGSFQFAKEALLFAKENYIELAFLDIEMPGMDGIELAQKLRQLYPMIIIIFVSAYNEYLPKAVNIDADYFIMKPYSDKNVADVVNKAKLLSARLDKKIFLKTFGSFDMFIDKKPVYFKSEKAKELLAYLVDRNGSVVTPQEGFGVLWEDKPYDHNLAGMYRRALTSLKSTLESIGAQDLIITFPKGCAINKAKADSDYFKFLAGYKEVIDNWNGEYMTNYSWGEFTLSSLTYKIDFLGK